MKSPQKFFSALFVASLIASCLMLSGCGKTDLTQSDHQVHQAWSAVEQSYRQRIQVAGPALEAARNTPEFNREALDAAVLAIEKANEQPPDAAFSDNLMVFDHFKQAQGELTAALFRLLISARAHPNLANSPQFQALGQVLANHEARLQQARDHYSSAIVRYNTLVDSFPTKITAWIFGFEAREDFVRKPAH